MSVIVKLMTSQV